MLIAVAGLAGAGKSTATVHMEAAGFGRRVYVGEHIAKAVHEQGLDHTPENERRVRLALRQKHGRHALARMALATIEQQMKDGVVLLDAVCAPEEWEFYRQQLEPPLVLIGIKADFEHRIRRLSRRSERPLTADEVLQRDGVESRELHLPDVFDLADTIIHNDGSIEQFKSELDHHVASFLASRA